MSFLNWKEQGPERLTQDVSAHSRREHQLKLVLGPEGLAELVSRLEEVFRADEMELRLELPRQWVVFFKLRPEGDESHLLVAHPEKDVWVATIALAPIHAERLWVALRGLNSAGEVPISEMGTVSGISNLELVIALH